MDAIQALEKLAADPELGERLTRLEIVPARPARYGEPEKPLHPEVVERLAARGAEKLYVHQSEAIGRLRAGRSVALATGTGSGKSLCYQVPIAESVLAGRKGTALLLFPTKALAHDQLRSLRSWLVPGKPWRTTASRPATSMPSSRALVAATPRSSPFERAVSSCRRSSGR